MSRVCLCCVLLLTPGVCWASPEIPGEAQKQPVALVGGTVHVASGPALENATLLFDQGRIVAVGPQVSVPKDAQRIDVSGKHVYPGLLDSFSAMGLVEIDAVRATVDRSESGSVNPNVRAEVAVNPDSELIPVTRSNGVLLAVTTPSGGLISGRAAVLQLDGWTWEEMTLQSGVALRVNWPRMAPVSHWSVPESARQQMDSRDRQLQSLEQVFEDARRYVQARQDDPQLPADTRWESMRAVLDKQLPLLAVADEAQQIQSALAFAQRHDVRLIIYGGYDAPACAGLLKRHEVPVIVGGVHRLPQRRSDAYDTPFTVPNRLREAGVQYCISGAGRFGASGVRNLPYHAATAAAYGLPRDQALRSITLYPAQILGVADRVGSLEPGKHATLFVSDDDILETPAHVERAWIQGRQVDLNDRHKRLWRKYQEKYRRQK